MSMYVLTCIYICMYCTVLLCYVTLRYVMLCYAMSCYVMLRTDMHTYAYIYMNILNGVYKPTYKNKHHLTWKATMTAGRSTHGVDTCVLANESLVVAWPWGWCPVMWMLLYKLHELQLYLPINHRIQPLIKSFFRRFWTLSLKRGPHPVRFIIFWGQKFGIFELIWPSQGSGSMNNS